MRVSLGLRGDYAIRAMLVIAGAEDQGKPMSVTEISRRVAIPVRFLPHVMADLARAGLVVGVPGRAGGYRLARPASEIRVLMIVDAVEPEPVTPRCVLRGGPCRVDGRCVVHDVFDAATRGMRAELTRDSLADLVPEA